MVFRNLYKDLLENPPKESEPKFKVNQKVRWSLVKPVFEKGLVVHNKNFYVMI